MKKQTGIIAAVAATAALLAGGAAAIATSSDTELTAKSDDLFKPGAEMFFEVTCDLPRAELTTSFGAHTTLTPAADAAILIGDLNVPTEIGPGPDNGYHTFTVTCGDQTLTQRMPSHGNGDNA